MTVILSQNEAKELYMGLMIGAKALGIASDWGVGDVEVDPPKHWDLVAYEENEEDGWANVGAIEDKLKELAELVKPEEEEPEVEPE